MLAFFLSQEHQAPSHLGAFVPLVPLSRKVSSFPFPNAKIVAWLDSSYHWGLSSSDTPGRPCWIIWSSAFSQLFFIPLPCYTGMFSPCHHSKNCSSVLYVFTCSVFLPLEFQHHESGGLCLSGLLLPLQCLEHSRCSVSSY